MTQPLDTTQFNDLLTSLTRPSALMEAGVLVGCLLLSWALVRLMRRGLTLDHSIWFGERIVDGVLFPVVALASAYAARLAFLLEAMDEVQWKVGATHITLRNVVEGTLTAGLVMVLALWVSAAIERQLLRSATGDDLSIRKMAANLVRALLLFVGLLLALSAVGIDLTALGVVFLRQVALLGWL